MKWGLVFLVFVFALGPLNAQTDSIKKHKIDSLQSKLQTDSLWTFRFKKLRPYGALDNRNSFITSKPVNIAGVQLGIIVNEYHTFGIGIYRLNPDSRKSPIKSGYRIGRLNYFTAFYEYFLLNKRFLEIDLPFELGFGRYDARINESPESKRVRRLSSTFLPAGMGLKVILKPMRWIGLSAMGGYRFVMENHAYLDLDGIYYSFGVWVDLRQIYRDTKYFGFQKRRYRREVEAVMKGEK